MVLGALLTRGLPMDRSTIITVIFSGSFLAFLQFVITFFITRKDNKEKEAKEEKKAEANAAKDERFEQLEDEIHAGLDEREKVGKSRYEEHKQAIADMSKEHQEQFKKLLEAIEGLREHDEKVAKTLEQIADGQQVLSTGLLGLTHFELMYIMDIIKQRKYNTLTEKDTMESLFEPYTALGGNGTIAQGHSYVMSLPVISDIEAKKMDEEIAAIKAHSFFKKDP